VRIELVEDQRAVELARDGDPSGKVFSADVFARRVARVRGEDRRKAAAQHFAP
jgi:hypothetical protein